MHFYKLFELKCVLAACVHNHHIMIKIHPVDLLKSLPLSQIEPISVWPHTDGGPSHDCWLTEAFQHRLHWCLTSDPPWVSCQQMFNCRSRCRQEWLLSDWGVLLLDVIMNITWSFTPVIWAAEEDYVWFWRESALELPKCVYVRANHSWSSFIYRRSEYKVFLNESLKTAFPNNELISKFHNECG